MLELVDSPDLKSGGDFSVWVRLPPAAQNIISMTNEKILSQAKRERVEFISLQFTDLFGAIKEVIIPIEKLKEALFNGIWFDGSSIEGFARIQESDLFLKPDINTYSIIPWLVGEGKTARFICDIYKPNGEPFEGDPRFILKRSVKEGEKMGFEYNVGPEPEFYLFKKDENSVMAFMDEGGYFDISSHHGFRVVREIISALKSFGMEVETSHHEVGKSQYEVDFKYGGALEVADKLLTLKYTVKKIAQAHNLVATFMAKPIEGAAGSGMHVHQSLFKKNTKENLFFSRGDKYGLSNIAYHFIAGQLKNIKAMSAILCPTVNSYKRLVSGFEAPVYITWAGMNRSALIRIPKWFKQKPSSARIELRCPDPTLNPYLSFAVMLKTGLWGIKSKLNPPQPTEENVYQLEEEILLNRKIDTLPTSLWEALNEMKKNEILKETLGKDLFKKYLEIKEREWTEFKTQVTSWELDKYLEAY